MKFTPLVISERKKISLELNFQAVNNTPGAPPERAPEPTLEEIALSKSFLNNPVLKALADKIGLIVTKVEKILPEERRYTQDEAINEIKLRLQLPEANSKKIFKGMVEKGTLEPIKDTGYFFLSGSTPF